jgi:hypothetical protein
LATRFLSDTHDIWAVNQLAERWSKEIYKDEKLSPPLVEADYNKSIEMFIAITIDVVDTGLSKVLVKELSEV